MINTTGMQLSTGEIIAAVSADSHIVEPDNCYVDHIESRYQAVAPRIKREDVNGVLSDVFVVDGLKERIPVRGVASAGCDPKKGLYSGIVDDEHQGGWDANIRIKDQDRDGIAAEILYPSLGMVLCAHPDSDYKQACMWAYNRWLREFVGQHPGRLFALGQTAVRSVAEAVQDVRRMEEWGFKGVMLPGFPDTEEDYNDPCFDPLWEAVVDLDMPICFHILTTYNKKDTGGNFVMAPKQRGKSRLVQFQTIIRGVQDVLGMFTFDGVFDRHPKLKLVCTEADAGWMPHYMYRADHSYKRLRASLKATELAKLPSEYFKENIYVTFQDDWIALQLTHMMNPRRMMWANDFPHSDSTWPNSQALLKSHASHLSDDEKRWILRDNVTELYKLQIAT